MTTMTPARAVLPLQHRVSGTRARLDSTVRLVAGSALWLSLLLVTYWWAAGGGIADLATTVGALTSVGRLTGLVASVLLLAQVVLMARVPALERAFGQDRLARMHRVVGFTGFNLMLAHIVLITWGYAVGSLAGVPGTFWTLMWQDPGMLLAVAGTVCLFLVVGTSIRAARRRIRYESWHLLHLYAYLGVGLALPHQLWTGHEFLASPARTAFWWTAWAVAAGSVLVWRLALPLWRSARHQLKVTSVVAEAPGIASVYMSGRALHRMPVEAGQFFTWRFLGRPGWSRANPFSLSAAPDGRSLRITVQDVGDGSRDVHRLTPGTRVVVEGPYGRMSARARTQRRVAFIGAGVGMAPLRALAEEMSYAPGDAIYVERYGDTPLFAREVDQLCHERGLQVLRLPGHRRADWSWLPQGVAPFSDLDALRGWVPDIAHRDVYVCGPAVWADLVTRDLLASGLPPEQLHVETFAW